MQQIYHKKNELFEVEFYQNKECTIPFDFKNAKNLYIDGLNGDVTPIFKLHILGSFNIFTPYIPQSLLNECKHGLVNTYVKTLNDITPNLSKYIPEDNAVLFLSDDCCEKYMQCFQNHHISLYANDGLDKVTLEGSINAINEFVKNPIKKLTIFLQHGTQAELEKAEEVVKELKEKYGVEEVNLFALHNFIKYDVLHYEILNIDESDYFNKTPEEAFEYIQNTLDSDDEDFVEKYIKEYDDEFREDFEKKKNDFFKSLLFNKITTTNSTGILEPQNNERLQVIDCKEIFEEYLKTER